MLMKRFIMASFSTQSHHHHKITDLVKRMTNAQQTLQRQNQDIKELTKQMKDQQQLNKKRNNQVHQMRVRLTDDMKKAELIWSDAKKKVQQNKSQAINSFAKGLFKLADQLDKTKSFQTEQHSVELKEGFQLTSRLFYTTLGKFKIERTEIKENDKLKKGEFEKVKDIPTEQATLKGAVAKVEAQGWTIQGKIVSLPKVSVFV